MKQRIIYIKFSEPLRIIIPRTKIWDYYRRWIWVFIIIVYGFSLPDYSIGLCDVLQFDMTKKWGNYDKFEEKPTILDTELKNVNVPAKLQAPLSKTHPSRLKLALQRWEMKYKPRL